MPTDGSYRVHELLPDRLTTITCPKCARTGRYKRETLLERFGPDKALPDVLVALAACPRARDMTNICGVVYAEPLGR
jgi:hypothetical protein